MLKNFLIENGYWPDQIYKLKINGKEMKNISSKYQLKEQDCVVVNDERTFVYRNMDVIAKARK